MNENLVIQCLEDQQQELLNRQEYAALVQRCEVDLIDLDSPLAQVVTGVRRSGKSTLCQMALHRRGEKFGYVNFDDDRLADLKSEDLSDILTAVYRIYGTDIKYLFFDEIQNVDGWHLFVSRLLRQGHRILLTGSNAKLLSTELTTHLTGRYNEITLFPFSFADFCALQGVETQSLSTKYVAERMEAFQRYLIEGGFPELISIKNKAGYVNGLIDTIITKDIKTRFHIRNAEGLKTLAYHLIDSVGQFINVTSIQETFGIGSEKTIRNYITYLSQAYLLLPLNKFSYKIKERLRNEKSYIVDNGMYTYHSKNISSENLGWRLENAVYIEILRRITPLFQEVYYYRPTSRSQEIDFVITERGKVVELVQVAYDISKERTLNRELSALAEVANALKCDNLTLVTLDKSRDVTFKNKQIKIRAAIEWFLQK